MSKRRVKGSKIAVIILTGVLLIGSLGLSGCSGDSSEGDGSSNTETKTIKVANYYATDHPVNVNLTEIFKKKVEEETNGQVVVEIYPNNQLGDEQEFVEGVQIGTVEMAMTGNLWENTVPEFRLMQMPYMFLNYDHADAVANGEIGEEIYEYLKPLGVKVLGSFPNGFRVVSNNIRPINSVDDTSGINLRVFEGETIINLMQALGFETTVMSISELFTSLQQGVVDGQDNPLATSFYSGFYDVLDHVAITNHMYSPGYMVINGEVWESLSDEQQQIVESAAKDTVAKIKNDVESQDQDIIDQITEKGVEVTYPELDGFVKKAKPMTDEFVSEYPHTQGIVDQINKLAEDFK